MNPDGTKRMSCLAIAAIVVASVAVLLFIVLGAILYPVFSKAREKARQEGCIDHLRVLGAAARMYAQDYDDKFPPKAAWCDAVGSYISPEALKEYTSREVVYTCPTRRSQRSGYAWNSTLPDSLAQTEYPESSVMLFDARADWNTVGDSAIADARHWNGMNVCFVDGQVKAFENFPLPVEGR